MERMRFGFVKILGFVLFLALVISNAAWYVAYQSVNNRLDVANATLGTHNSPSPSATASPSPAKGTIAGNVGFPAGTAPAQTICAVSNMDATLKFCVDHPGGNSLAYQLAVPAGSYTVYSSLKASQGDYKTTYKAYYDKFVTCGSSSNCAMGLHGQNEVVTVVAGGTVSAVDPNDWYRLGITQEF